MHRQDLSIDISDATEYKTQQINNIYEESSGKDL